MNLIAKQFEEIKASFREKHSLTLKKFDELVQELTVRKDELKGLAVSVRHRIFVSASKSGNYPLMLSVLDARNKEEKKVYDFLVEKMRDDCCSICLMKWDDVKEFGRLGSLKQHSCKNVFHALCLDRMQYEKCPLCRRRASR